MSTRAKLSAGTRALAAKKPPAVGKLDAYGASYARIVEKSCDLLIGLVETARGDGGMLVEASCSSGVRASSSSPDAVEGSVRPVRLRGLAPRISEAQAGEPGSSTAKASRGNDEQGSGGFSNH
jgi:hypothetical protein